MRAALPPNEDERIEALNRYNILDSDPEREFDDITLLASQICGTPIAMISLVDNNRQWFKSKVGMAASQTSRDIAFCAHGILQAEVFVVTDAQADSRFASNPLVTGETRIRFYAGSPLVTSDGYALGMLCVNDLVSRELSAEQKTALEVLSRQVVALLELRRIGKDLRQTVDQLKQTQAELAATHSRLLEASRRGGMAEIATNVLHNVGNVLNSVNISTDLVVERVKKSKTAGLAKVVDLLGQHAHDLGDFVTKDAKGKHAPVYLADVTRCIIADQAAIVAELDSLRRNVEHIKEIVSMQQNYAGIGGVKEMIDVVELVEQSLLMNEISFTHHQVEIVREFEAVQPMNVEKHKILQILVNLMRNAKFACNDSERADKRITVRVAKSGGNVNISVTDNGIGIPPENMTRIFNHGFTTRKGGHGFGLHCCALVAREIGGSLTAYSDGLGQGATFALELPCPAREETNGKST